MSATGAICGPSTVERLRMVGPDLWCFVCREHRMHYTVLAVPADPLSYWSAYRSNRCDRCDSPAVDFLGNPRFIPIVAEEATNA